MDYKYKTAPFLHQDQRFHLYRDKEFHAHLWEQRCGKSKVSIDTAAWLNLNGRITGLLVLAPCGVHLNWVRNEIPTHMPDYVGCEPVVYKSSPNAEERRGLERLCKQGGHGLRALSMNLEALRSEKGFNFAVNFLRSFRCMTVVDEGSAIKNFSAIQTKRVLELKKLSPIRRVLNGTPVTQSPLDVYPQFSFLDWDILGKSHVNFRSRYAIIEHQGRMKREVAKQLESIAGRCGSYPWGDLVYTEERGTIEAGSQPLADGWPPIEFTVKQAGQTIYKMDWRCGKMSGSEKMIFNAGEVYPVITGYRHLEELRALIAPHSDRVLKADCLDLPDKIYQKRYIEMSSDQEKLYKELKKNSIAECSGRQISTGLAITKMLRLQQIIGGFFVPDNVAPMDGEWSEEKEELSIERLDRSAIPIPGKNPKVEALLEDIENGLTGKGIVWARFQAEIELIAKALRKEYGMASVAELYGKVDSTVRQSAIDMFQRPESPLRFLVANPACKGVSRGQNMCAADWEWYFSNSFSLEDRLQSEDRPHSPGQQNHLGVIDAVMTGTLDDKVIEALRTKQNLADLVTGDNVKDWI